MADAERLPMACCCGEDGEEKMADLHSRCIKALNESDDWLPVDELDVDMLVHAVCLEGYTIEIYADQWFGIAAEPVIDGQRIYLAADRVVDGLAAIYVHQRSKHGD